jgi:hypothetical protein
MKTAKAIEGEIISTKLPPPSAGPPLPASFQHVYVGGGGKNTGRGLCRCRRLEGWGIIRENGEWKMKTAKAIEAEINRIRVEIYEETKGLSPCQRAEQTNRIAQAFAEQYGFKIVTDSADSAAGSADSAADSVEV